MKIVHLLRIMVILSGFLPWIISGQEPTADQVKLGLAKVNITPQKPTLMSGYGARATPFTGVHDSLYASAFFFTGDNVKMLLITSDIIGFYSLNILDEILHEISLKPKSLLIIS
jgi:hypothetical protein